MFTSKDEGRIENFLSNVYSLPKFIEVNNNKLHFKSPSDSQVEERKMRSGQEYRYFNLDINDNYNFGRIVHATLFLDFHNREWQDFI